MKDIDFAAIAANERLAEEFRAECLAEFAHYPRLLSESRKNTKLRKSHRDEYRIASLALAHHRTSGHNVCPQASAGCSAGCVGGDNVGLAAFFGRVMAGRIAKTKALFADRPTFLRRLIGELHREQLAADRNGQTLCVRLNTFADIPWEEPHFGCIPQLFNSAVFYDYTKIHRRVYNAPDNYSICGSWSELKRHQDACIQLLRDGFNVSIVFHSPGAYAGNAALRQRLPARIQLEGAWYQVFPGDDHDLRFLDPGKTRSGRGRVCGLVLKAGNKVSRSWSIERQFSIEVA